MNALLPPPAWEVAIRHMIRLGAAAVTMGIRRLPQDLRSGDAARVALHALHDVNCATFSDRSFEEIGATLIAGLDPLVELGFEPIGLFALAVGGSRADPEAESAIREGLRRHMDDVDARFLSGLRDSLKKRRRVFSRKDWSNYAPRVLKEHSKPCSDIPVEELEGAMHRLLELRRLRVETEGPPTRRRSHLVIVEIPENDA